MLERTRRVILLIDYDNLQICASRDTPGRELQLPPVVQLAQRFGTVIMARAYAEWNLSTERLAVYKAGIEPAFAPVLRTESDRSGKSLADTVMVAEGMDMLWTLSPDVLVLATSDKDLIPLVRVAKQRGARVVVLGSDFTAIPLREMADEHITYKQLITDTAGRYTEPAPARAPAPPAEPSRRTRSTREPREPRTPAPAASTAPPAPVPTTTPERPAAAPAAAAAEPVAPTLAGDLDGAAGVRRRRRRGSRRRGDRLGVGPDGSDLGSGDGESDADADVDVDAEMDAGAELQDPAVGAEEEAPVAAADADEGVVEEDAQPEPATPLIEAGALPDAVVATETEPAEAATDAVAQEAPPPDEAEPPSETAATEGETPAEDGEAADAPPARRTRTRRVASASRGRSRPSTRSP